MLLSSIGQTVCSLSIKICVESDAESSSIAKLVTKKIDFTRFNYRTSSFVSINTQNQTYHVKCELYDFMLSVYQ